MAINVNNKQIAKFQVSELTFDAKNPRLAGLEVGQSEAELIKILWETMDVQELVLSIAASGYFEHEPVIVVQEDSKNVVIEGNRRLAAVKLLLSPHLGRELDADVPSITEERRDALREIPALVSSRKGAWRYLGFKHVNGPQKWGSYAKSQYIADVHRNYDVPLDDIAQQIGDTHKTVRRLYRGLMVIEQAEDIGAYQRSDRWRGHFAFSHLYAGLGYQGISDFLDLRSADDEDPQPIPLENKEKLRELLVWMYGSKREKIPPVIQSQNPHLRQLDAVVSSTEAVAALRNGVDLSVAFEASRPSGSVFEEALVGAKRNLEKARATLSSGYDGSKSLLGIAEDLADLAYDLHEEMQRKSRPSSRRRR